MEWVVALLLLLNMSILGVIALIMAGFLAHLRSDREVTTPVPQETKEEPVKDDTDETVPLEQFKPDFTKPLTVVVKEDDYEEDQDNR